MAFPSPNLLRNPLPTLLLFPAFFTSIWLWLYAGAGFLLKAARRFDIGFQWFNHKFDIEKKPLSSIGLVAGALVFIMYCGFAFTGPMFQLLFNHPWTFGIVALSR